MIRKGIILLIYVCALMACQPKPKKTLLIAVAASAQFAFEEVRIAFEKKHNINCKLISGSSGKLYAQIMQNAPFDIFISADTIYPNLVFQNNKNYDSVITYAYGVPVLWTMYDSMLPKDIKTKLNFEKIRKFAIADVRNAPYGKMAKLFLENTGQWIDDKMVFGESISQVNEYIVSKHASLGISSKSIVSSKDMRNKGYWMALPKNYEIPQALVAINNGKEKEKSLFLNFIKSKEAKDILTKNGYNTQY